jgi:hypothetical protein
MQPIHVGRLKSIYFKMKFILFAFLVSFSVNCYAQKADGEFSIYFGNDFIDDSVTIIINGVQIANNIKLSATMIDPKNLIITQDKHSLSVWPHHREKQIFKKIPIKDSILNVNMQLNKVWKNFKFNLNQGRVFYPQYSILLTVGWTIFKVFTIRQSRSGPIMW